MMSDARVWRGRTTGIGAATLAEVNGLQMRRGAPCRELVFEPGARAEKGDGARLAWRACAPSGRVVFVRAARDRSADAFAEGGVRVSKPDRGGLLEVGPSTMLAGIARMLSKTVGEGDAVFVGSVERLISTIGINRAIIAVREILKWCSREGVGLVLSSDPARMTDSEIALLTWAFEDCAGRGVLAQ